MQDLTNSRARSTKHQSVSVTKIIMDLNGKVALITGAAHGIGLATAKLLLKNGVKAVSICDIDVNKGEDAAKSISAEFGNDRIVFIKTDVTNQHDFENAFKKTKEIFKGIDIVINNAGIINDDIWEKEIDINVKGVVRGTKLALEYMGKHKGHQGGTLVNIASVAGLGKNSASPVYDGTKFFVVGFTKSMSFPPLSASHGIRILCMCPGITDTPIAEGVFVGYEKLKVERQVVLSMCTLQEPEDVAEGIVHILEKGESGSVWVSDAKQPVYSVELPDLVI